MYPGRVFRIKRFTASLLVQSGLLLFLGLSAHAAKSPEAESEPKVSQGQSLHWDSISDWAAQKSKNSLQEKPDPWQVNLINQTGKSIPKSCFQRQLDDFETTLTNPGSVVHQTLKRARSWKLDVVLYTQDPKDFKGYSTQTMMFGRPVYAQRKGSIQDPLGGTIELHFVLGSDFDENACIGLSSLLEIENLFLDQKLLEHLAIDSRSVGVAKPRVVDRSPAIDRPDDSEGRFSGAISGHQNLKVRPTVGYDTHRHEINAGLSVPIGRKSKAIRASRK